MSTIDMHPSGGLSSAINDRLGEILAGTDDGFFVIDSNYRFVEVNHAFCRMLGYDRDELLRLDLTTLEIDDQHSSFESVGPLTGLHRLLAAYRHRDGHAVHLELSVTVLQSGAAKILAGFARDVTERNRTEQALMRLVSQQKLILHSAAEGIAALDAGGVITLANPAAAHILGGPLGELIGRSAHVVFGLKDCSSSECTELECPICKVLRGGADVRNIAAELRRFDNAPLPAEYSLAATRESGRTIGAVLVFRDMTERLQAEEERREWQQRLSESERLKSIGRLAGGIAHNLNNTLAGILGNAQMGMTELPESHPVYARLKRIEAACTLSKKTIRQILAYSGNVACDPAPMALNGLIRDMSEFLRAAVPRNITLDVELAAHSPVVNADASELQQILTNLIINSVEAIGNESGRIVVSTTTLELNAAAARNDFRGDALTPGRYACFVVEDNGCGMSAETLARLFEPYFSQKGTGRGLGLAAMLGVVRAHGGGVRVESQAGRGTRFTIALPLTMQAESLEARAPELRGNLRDGLTVLVVDDDDAVREVVTDMLTNRGLQAIAAADGFSGVELYRRHAREIDVVLLDMTMPRKSGAEVFREILSVRADAKVIVLSGYSEASVPARFGEQRPAGFLAKPFTMNDLMQKIANVTAAQGYLS